MTSPDRRSYSEPGPEKQAITEWVWKFIDDQLRIHSGVKLTEQDVLEDVIPNMGLSLAEVVRKAIFEADLGGIALTTFLRMFPQFADVAQNYYPEIDVIASERVENVLEEGSFELENILETRLTHNQVVSQEVLDAVRQVTVSEKTDVNFNLSYEEIVAVEQFVLRIVEKAKPVRVGDSISVNPVEFKKQLDWEFLIRGQSPAIFSIDNTCRFAVILPEMGWSDHLSETGSILERTIVKSGKFFPDNNQNNYDVSKVLIVPDTQDNKELFEEILRSPELTSALLKSFFLLRSQLHIIDRLVQGFVEAAELKEWHIHMFGEDLKSYFFYQLLSKIPKGKRVSLVTTIPISKQDTQSEGHRALQFMLKAREDGRFEIGVSEKPLDHTFTKTSWNSDGTAHCYIVEMQQEAGDVTLSTIPEFFYTKVRNRSQKNQDRERGEVPSMRNLRSAQSTSEWLSILFDLMLPFSQGDLTEMYSFSDAEKRDFHRYFQELPSVVSFLGHLNVMNKNETSEGKLYKVLAKAPVSFSTENPPKNILTTIGTTVASNN